MILLHLNILPRLLGQGCPAPCLSGLHHIEAKLLKNGGLPPGFFFPVPSVTSEGEREVCRSGCSCSPKIPSLPLQYKRRTCRLADTVFGTTIIYMI